MKAARGQQNGGGGAVPGTKWRGTTTKIRQVYLPPPTLHPPPSSPPHCLTLTCYFTKALSGVWRDRTSEGKALLKATRPLSWLCHGSASEELLQVQFWAFLLFAHRVTRQLLCRDPHSLRGPLTGQAAGNSRRDGADRGTFPCNTGREKLPSTLFELEEKCP